MKQQNPLKKYLIFQKFLYYKVNRKTKINVIGGGVVQDISSFSCSIYLRGLNGIFTQLHFWHKPIAVLDQKPLLTSIKQKSYRKFLSTIKDYN